MNRKLSDQARAAVLAVRAIHPAYFDEATRLLERAAGIAEGMDSAAAHSEFYGADILSHKQVCAMANAVAEDVNAALALLERWYAEDFEERRAGECYAPAGPGPANADGTYSDAQIGAALAGLDALCERDGQGGRGQAPGGAA